MQLMMILVSCYMFVNFSFAMQVPDIKEIRPIEDVKISLEKQKDNLYFLSIYLNNPQDLRGEFHDIKFSAEIPNVSKDKKIKLTPYFFGSSSVDEDSVVEILLSDYNLDVSIYHLEKEIFTCLYPIKLSQSITPILSNKIEERKKALNVTILGTEELRRINNDLKEEKLFLNVNNIILQENDSNIDKWNKFTTKTLENVYSDLKLEIARLKKELDLLFRRNDKKYDQQISELKEQMRNFERQLKYPCFWVPYVKNVK